MKKNCSDATNACEKWASTSARKAIFATPLLLKVLRVQNLVNRGFRGDANAVFHELHVPCFMVFLSSVWRGVF